jgi:predicted transcriptional regulator
MDVKERIQAIIDSRPDLSVRNVALKAGLSDSLLHKFLSNPEQSMTLRSLEKVAEAMGVTLRYVLFGEHEPVEPVDAEVREIWSGLSTARREEAKELLAVIARRKV